VTDPAVAATCTKTGLTAGSRCKVCGKVLTAQNTVPVTDHTPYVSSPAVQPTQTQAGHTQEIKCSVCGTLIQAAEVIPATGYSDPSLYTGTFGYDYLSKLSNTAGRQAFYKKLESLAADFHKGQRDAGYTVTHPFDSLTQSLKSQGYKVVADVDTSSYGLTQDELSETWYLFRHDHPLYYWMASGFVYYTYGSTVYFPLVCFEEYSTAAVITASNQLIYAGVEQLHVEASQYTSAYGKALAIHDAVCNSIEYRFSSPGVPDPSAEAHSILGYFTGNGGVCECYSKTFSLMMNFMGIENALVNNAVHMWNLVKLDGYGWYWVDLTYDDPYNYPDKIMHVYFCRNDTEEVFKNSGWVGSGTFLDQSDHDLLPPGNSSTELSDEMKARYPGATTYHDINIVLVTEYPARASSPYSGPKN
jgi:hypothetical protein